MDLTAERERLRRRWRASGWHSDRTIGDELTDAAAAHPDLELTLVSATRPAAVTLAEIHRRARGVAAGFTELGLSAGDAVVTQVPNWVEGAITVHAAFLAGLVVVPVIHIYGPA